jgi:hypothetical protein
MTSNLGHRWFLWYEQLKKETSKNNGGWIGKRQGRKQQKNARYRRPFI